MSQPPCMRKPQGDPPKRVTSLALIPRRCRRSSSAAGTSAFSRVARNRVYAATFAALASRGETLLGDACHSRLSRHVTISSREPEETAGTGGQRADGDGRRLHPDDANRDANRSHARARDPHSSVARVELTARPSSLPHHYAPA